MEESRMQFISWKALNAALLVFAPPLNTYAESQPEHPTVIVGMNTRATYLAKGPEVNGHSSIQLRAAALLTLSTPHACGSNEIYMTPESAGIPDDSFRRALDEVQQLIDQKIPLLLTHTVCERKRAFLVKVRPCTPEECGELTASLVDGKQYLDREFSPTGQGQAYYYVKMPMEYDSKRKAWVAQIFFVETQTPSHEYFVDKADFVSGKAVHAYRSYYRSGKLRQSYKSDAHGLRQGEALTYSESGIVIKREGYLNDELEGWQSIYHDNGKIAESYNWQLGKRVDGEYLEYDEDGALISRSSYRNDVWDGPALGYYPNGQLRYSTLFVNGKAQGPSTHYFENGAIQLTRNDIDSKPDGWLITYFIDGKIEEKAFYRAGFRQSFERWNEQGVQTVQWQWDELHREQGDFKEWYKNGQLKEQKTYEAGKLEGPFRAWYENGQIKTAADYKSFLGRGWPPDPRVLLRGR
ncbi:toxin-antitoxin system YwqK family antitoxin [Pseudomonas sp. C2B4]|uniref:toxin-antitoxin system YwqK family antitoxin n=1 Tax=Pseudomonas sp. C2B4 TaxID=2735270 RepID=UPI0021157FC0|nr:toxin-antitoxin system YwqK family antitoxin [Pseudomonas sp. C2B4]